MRKATKQKIEWKLVQESPLTSFETSDSKKQPIYNMALFSSFYKNKKRKQKIRKHSRIFDLDAIFLRDNDPRTVSLSLSMFKYYCLTRLQIIISEGTYDF